jgi:7-cyano-7-deazaguanine synthase in queuosine biosynthesis
MPVSVGKICTACVLPDSFPGIGFDSQGLCNFCQDAPPVATVTERFQALRAKMAAAIEARKSPGSNGYDCIVAFSGGKDSTYILKLLIETYQMSCLAVTIDNGFMSDQAKKNCDGVTSALGVDYVVFKPSSDFMNNMYVQSVRSPEVHAKVASKRASNMCNSCINLINIHMIKLAMQHDAPVVAGGYIGGQVPKDAAIMDIDLSVLIKSRQAMQSRYTTFFGETAMKYMQLPEDLVERSHLKNVLIVNPMLTVEVTEEQIIDDIRALGWKRTVDTGKNSSNCRLNDLGIAVHHRQYGFNPYVFEISEQVRNGLMDRQTGLDKAYSIPELSEVAWQAKQIGLSLDEI